MISQPPQSLTSTVRKLCEQIEIQISSLLKKTLFSPSSTPLPRTQVGRNHFQRSIEELKSAVVQVLTCRLPTLIAIEQALEQQVEDLKEERDQWCEKYRKIFRQFQQGQLANDRLKVEVVALSQSYEQLSIAFETLKYQHNQLKEQRSHQVEKGQRERNEGNRLRLAQLNLLSRDSASSSEHQGSFPSEGGGSAIRAATQAMLIEKQMFLKEIRDSQKQIFAFRSHIEQLQLDKNRLEQENQELGMLLVGQKGRSDKCDRQVLQILNRNQELKLELLEVKQAMAKKEEDNQQLQGKIEKQKQECAVLASQKEGLAGLLLNQKQMVTQMKLQQSQQRQHNHALEERQRELKIKVAQMKKQNEQLRVELQKLIQQLNQKTITLEHLQQQTSFQLKKQSQQHHSLINKLQTTSKTNLHQKMKQISKMHKDITHKLEQKIQLLQKNNKQKKDKNAQLKYQVQRLYESLKIQVEKQFKSTEKIKELQKRMDSAENQKRIAEDRAIKAEEIKIALQDSTKILKSELNKANARLKKYLQLSKNLSKAVLPHLKQQLHSIRQLCLHFCSMVSLQKQQTCLLLTRQQQHFKQLLHQFILHQNVLKEQSELAHFQEISKWKQNCRIYEERYDRLQGDGRNMEELCAKLQRQNEDLIKQCQGLGEQNQKRKNEQLSTGKTIQKLKQKCREVQQYYRLTEDLSRENTLLKSKLQKLQTISQYSFKSPEKNYQLDSTSKRHRTQENLLQRYNKTTNLPRPARAEEVTMHDLTAKAEFQKMRLQAARKEYQMVNNGNHRQ